MYEKNKNIGKYLGSFRTGLSVLKQGVQNRITLPSLANEGVLRNVDYSHKAWHILGLKGRDDLCVFLYGNHLEGLSG